MEHLNPKFQTGYCDHNYIDSQSIENGIIQRPLSKDIPRL